jgi:hypothetical protein
MGLDRAKRFLQTPIFKPQLKFKDEIRLLRATFTRCHQL